MQIVIDIPKRTYDGVSKNGCIVYGDDAYFIGHAIKNGIVLPKNYGRLIDADKLISHLEAHKELLIRHYADEAGNIPFEINSRIDQIRICMDDIANTSTVIEADNEVSE